MPTEAESKHYRRNFASQSIIMADKGIRLVKESLKAIDLP